MRGLGVVVAHADVGPPDLVLAHYLLDAFDNLSLTCSNITVIVFVSSQEKEALIQGCSMCGMSKVIKQTFMYANPVFWVPVSWGKVFGVLIPLPNC